MKGHESEYSRTETISNNLYKNQKDFASEETTQKFTKFKWNTWNKKQKEMRNKVHVHMCLHYASIKSTAGNKTRFLPSPFLISSRSSLT